MKCQVKNCENEAKFAFGTKWVCGKHLIELMKKKQEVEDKMLEEVE
jgi:hypothetical protein